MNLEWNTKTAVLLLLLVSAYPLAGAEPPVSPPGSCLFQACLETAGAGETLLSILPSNPARTPDGNTRCYFLPAQELFLAVTINPAAADPHRLDSIYLGVYPWPDCATATRTALPSDLLATAEGIRIGSTESQVSRSYQGVEGFHFEQNGAARVATFYPIPGHVVTEITLVSGKVVAIEISHSD